MSGIRLRHLAFTGSDAKTAELKFDNGLNIIYGASNTGKSFTAEAILYMLGVSSSLRETEEIANYDGVWLGLTIPGKGDLTLYRSSRGGAFKLYEGLVVSAGSEDGLVLKSQHDSKKTDNVSVMLLEAIGLSGKKIVRDKYGAKNNLSIYRLSPYVVVSEEDIIAQKSPVYASGVPAERIFERNLLKLLLTGIDDASAVTVPKEAERKAAKAAKIEFVNELITQLDDELSIVPEQKEVEEQLERLDQSARGLFPRLQDVQMELDNLVAERRAKVDRRREVEEHTSELDLTLQRFAKLRAVYASDLLRLQSIEEGGYVLVAMAGMDCPVCGASPDAQRHNHASEEIAMVHAAAAAEAGKIEVEQRELIETIASLEAETGGLRNALAQVIRDIERLDREIQDARPNEATVRVSYEKYAQKRGEISRVIELFERRAKLVARKEEIEAESTKRDGDAMPVGPTSTTAFEFGEVIKKVLTAWHFPDADKAQFDLSSNDVTISGKRRSANGKGVRAILHAAFNVAVFVYCIEKDLPHPGFLVLDTPLLTYREPLTSKHGDLSEDEAALKATSLSEYFYRHLASLKEEVQIIVLENSDPPVVARSLAKIETFTHLDESGRFGLLARPA
ncbi:hypothetical protein [uncultured Hoeflea sp.]|uniref:hypothetical protein n=1 Tax=uncultured Hoeflea sp. TaxID=538666 RepID=UPI0026066218|nr:hypothetical protein [uncultured Hoeflea sp.]